MIAESGGVQEISLAKSERYLTPKEKLKEARALVLATALATVSGDQIAAQNNPEKKGAQVVAVVTLVFFII